MKYASLILFALSVLFSGCSESDAEKLQAKRAALESAQSQLDQLKLEIRAMKDEIAQLDTSANRVKKKLVTTIDIDPKTFNHFIEIQGTVKSEDNIQVSTDMGGLVTRIPVEEGQNVSKGQTLVQLDNTVILRNIEELNTSLELAKVLFTKQERLWNQKIGSEVQYLQAKSNKESLERRLETSYSQLEKTKIKAPINGIVDEIHVKLGQMASPGLPAVRVVNNSDVEIEADVSEAHLGKINRGEQVVVSFPAINMEKKAKVKSIGQVINPNNRTFKIVVEVSNRDKVLKPNLLATIKVNDYSKEDAIVVPTRLIHHARGQEFVYTVSTGDNKLHIAEKVVVKTGKTYRGDTEIIQGLADGQTLINDGYRDVTPGEILRFDNESKN